VEGGVQRVKQQQQALLQQVAAVLMAEFMLMVK
jgi:hypothetical protein